MFWYVMTTSRMLSTNFTFLQILLEQLYSLPCARKPEHIIYDSNCNALCEVESHNIVFYQDIRMCVDAFHHKTKHRTSDMLCQERCNMKAYLELMDGKGGYYFNSLITMSGLAHFIIFVGRWPQWSMIVSWWDGHQAQLIHHGYSGCARQASLPPCTYIAFVTLVHSSDHVLICPSSMYLWWCETVHKDGNEFNWTKWWQNDSSKTAWNE